MVFRKINRRFIGQFDWELLAIVVLLCLVGVGLMFSAGFDAETGQSAPMKRQMRYVGVGFLSFVVCMFFNTTFWRRIAYLVYGIGCVLLLVILFEGVVAGGARRWLEIGSLRMQPSEFMKFGVILALARLFSGENAPRDGYTILKLLAPCVVLGIPVILILKEPDLGTALCYLLIGGSMLFLAGIRWSTTLRLFILAVILALPAWNFVLEDYQKQRVLTFMSPEQDPLGSGYHAIQSKIAVGSGALFGKGFLQGSQTQLRFLPEQTTDFIFSVLAEEWGFFGTAIVLTLYGMLIFRLLTVSSRCNKEFPAFVAFGVASLLFWHVLVNIGMVIGVLPVVGLTLPLLSYGGSSLVAVMSSLGVVAGFSIRRFMFA